MLGIFHFNFDILKIDQLTKNINDIKLIMKISCSPTCLVFVKKKVMYEHIKKDVDICVYI